MKSVGIIGIGKLGLCFALNLEKAGLNVTGIDINEKYVTDINSKTLISDEPFVTEYLLQSSNFVASINIADVVKDEIEIIFVMVATPSTKNGDYNHEQIERVINELIGFGKREQTVAVVVGCTVMPGYCNSLSTRLKEYNYEVCYNPEFIAQGNIIHDQQYPDQILIGETNQQSGDKLEAIYHALCKNKPAFCRMDLLSAEIAKLATNCFLTTKISFANSIGDLALKSGADPDKILQAVGADSRIGKKYLNYGFGFGGPCFPRDNRALGIYAKSWEQQLFLSEATDNVNQQHLEFQYENYLKEYSETKPIEFQYITYKENSLILEESQQLALALKLAQAGRKVIIYERESILKELNENYPGLFDLKLR